MHWGAVALGMVVEGGQGAFLHLERGADTHHGFLSVNHGEKVQGLVSLIETEIVFHHQP